MFAMDIGTEEEREIYITAPTEVPQEQPSRLPAITPSTPEPVKVPAAP